MINFSMKSQMPGMAFPAITSQGHAQLLATLWQLDKTQWLPSEQLRHQQLLQFAQLMRHAQRQVPFYRDRLGDLGSQKRPLNYDSLREIPLLTRSDIQLNHDSLQAKTLPSGHDSAGTTETSGSTGQTVKIGKSSVSQLFFQALTLREHFWHKRDVAGSVAVIRAEVEASPPEGNKDWGKPISALFHTGPGHQLPINTAISEQLDWLNRINPDYLLTYPNNLHELLIGAENGKLSIPNLKQVRTIGETLKSELRDRCEKLLGATIIDAYSSQEIGTIATQCPESGLYHTQETELVEVLRPDGTPCEAGESGRLVITDLTNFVMPLIRYEIRDYAEPGPPCPCGRGLPTLQRILGRQRNMIVLPNGDRYWPLIGYRKFEGIAKIRQYQLIQQSVTDVDMLLVLPKPLSQRQKMALTNVLHTALGHPFKINFIEQRGELPRTEGGKFEEFISKVS